SDDEIGIDRIDRDRDFNRPRRVRLGDAHDHMRRFVMRSASRDKPKGNDQRYKKRERSHEINPRKSGRRGIGGIVCGTMWTCTLPVSALRFLKESFGSQKVAPSRPEIHLPCGMPSTIFRA